MDIGSRFRESGKTLEEKNKDKKERIPMIRLSARRKIQIRLFGIDLRFILMRVFAD